MLQDSPEIIIDVLKFLTINDLDHWIRAIILRHWIYISPFCPVPVQDIGG